jgi:hypothetical protein
MVTTTKLPGCVYLPTYLLFQLCVVSEMCEDTWIGLIKTACVLQGSFCMHRVGHIQQGVGEGDGAGPWRAGGPAVFARTLDDEYSMMYVHVCMACLLAWLDGRWDSWMEEGECRTWGWNALLIQLLFLVCTHTYTTHTAILRTPAAVLTAAHAKSDVAPSVALGVAIRTT